MIRLTRINRTLLAINADLIKFVESAPDTVITLSTGEKVVVTESVDQIIELIIDFRRLVLTGIPCPAVGLYLAANSAARGPHLKHDRHLEPGTAR
ncbi:MAG TPA: flagellar FlbD family protein [Candidatus Angelobacter sp.]|nr:flagellar FlbD family protein [Candidatus Angelobacter sp.]